MKRAIKINIIFSILGLCNTVFAGPTIDTYSANQAKFAMEQRVKEYKLYGLNCSNCYISIVRQVESLPGVTYVRFYTNAKILVVKGTNIDDKAIRRICESEGQRIV